MVALRKRPNKDTAVAGVPEAPAAAGVEGGDATPSSPSPDNAAPAAAPPPADERLVEQINALRKAKAARQQAEAHQQEAARQQHEQATAQQRGIGEWVAARPGIDKDPRAIQVSQHLIRQGCVLGSPVWRKAMEQNGFAAKDYREPAE